MKILTSFIIMVLTFTVGEALRGEEKRGMNQEISKLSEVAGWKWDGKETRYNSKTLFDYVDGAAELYLAYGFQDLAVRRFEKANQPALIVEVYEMASSEDAYGVFSFERQDQPIGIGQEAEFGGGLLRFWKGKYFVSVYADGEGVEAEAAILKLGKAAADSIPANGPEPELVGFVPGTELGLVGKSVRYLRSHILLNQRFFIAHQNILRLNRKTEAVLAQYLREKQKIQLLLVRYPSLKEAGDAYQSFMKAYLPDAAGKDRAKTEDQKWTIARQRREFVLIVFGALTEVDAETLLKAAEERLPGGR
jgi:hypothetical protein